eukprot:6581386-Karenia_brevis.AAC.1
MFAGKKIHQQLIINVIASGAKLRLSDPSVLHAKIPRTGVLAQVMSQRFATEEIALCKKSVPVRLKDSAGRPAGVARKLQHVFEKLTAPIYKDPALVVKSELEPAFEKRPKVRNPRSGIVAQLEPRAANIQGQHLSTLLAIGRFDRMDAKALARCHKQIRKCSKRSVQKSRTK